MSAGDHITMPFASWEGIVTLLTAPGLGGVLTAWAQRPSRRAVNATAAKDEATGEAAVIASAFTGTTASLREEIERMQETLNEREKARSGQLKSVIDAQQRVATT